MGKRVVEGLLVGLEGRGHVVVMDNFFTSVELFRDLEQGGTYATGIVRSNRIGLPDFVKDQKAFKKLPQGNLKWAMHDSRKMCAVMWMDKKPVLLLSTSALPLSFPCEVVEVPRRGGGQIHKIKTSPVHLEYTTFMRGVDVADQLHGSYSCQVRSHKW